MPISPSLEEDSEDDKVIPNNSNANNQRINNTKHKKNKNSKFPIELQIYYKIDKIDEEVRVFGKKFYERYKNQPNTIQIMNPNRGFLEYIKLRKDQGFVLHINITQFLEDLSYIFAGCKKIVQIIGLDKLVNEKVTNISNMFLNCTSLRRIDNLSKFETKNIWLQVLRKFT